MRAPRDITTLTIQRHSLTRQLERGLDEARVPNGARVLLAVSGGADSMAMLALCAGLAARDRITVVAAHVDHGLRAESGREGDLVEQWARKLGVHIERLCITLARGSNVSARARAARYHVLTQAALQHGAHWVATAHHADDQFETMLMSLSRGTGLSRLAGMRRTRKLADGIKLVRPLLGIQREQLRAACRDLGIAWAEDATNADALRQRGTVRHRVIPELERAWPGCAPRAAGTSALLRWSANELRRQSRALAAAAQTPHGFSRTVLRKAPLAVVSAVVRSTAGTSFSQETLWTIARAIKDKTRRTRVWRGSKTRAGAKRAGAKHAGIEVRLTADVYSTVSLALRQRS